MKIYTVYPPCGRRLAPLAHAHPANSMNVLV